MHHTQLRKKAGAFLATALLGAAALSGCTAGGNDPAPAAGANGQSGARLEIDWMNYPGAIAEQSYGQQYLESTFGIKLKKLYPIAYADFKQKQQIQLSSGEVPDVLFILDPGELSKYASQGLLAEVPLDLIAKHAPRTKANLDKQAPQGWYYTNVGGKNYGLPTFYFTGQFHAKQVWRTDLLTKAGVAKIPETLEEFTAAFAALKKIGVYGMSTTGQSYYNQFHTIFGAYGLMPTQWMLKDGKVVNAAVQPEAKEALTLLADWYKAGYIDPEFVTGKDLGPKFNAGKYAFMDSAHVTSTDEDNPNSIVSAVRKVNPEGKVAFGPLPKGPKGLSGGWAWGTAGNIWAFGKQLEKQPEKLAKALEMMDAMQNDENTWLALAWGEKGKHWDFKDAAKGVEGGLKRTPSYEDVTMLQKDGIVDLASGVTFWGAQPNIDIIAKYYGKSGLEKFQLYNRSIFDLFGKSDILPSSGKYWGDLLKLKTEAYAAIVRGDKPAAYFDEFVKQWNDKGGAQLEKEANELYQASKK